MSRCNHSVPTPSSSRSHCPRCKKFVRGGTSTLCATCCNGESAPDVAAHQQSSANSKTKRTRHRVTPPDEARATDVAVCGAAESAGAGD